MTFMRPGDELHERKAAYLEQAGCIDDFLVSFADSISSSAVIVFVADHGTDMRNQLGRHPEDWHLEDSRERFNVLLSVRAPGCTLGDAMILPNVFRRIPSCLADDNVDDLEPEMFAYASVKIDGELSPVIKVDDLIVAELLDS